MTALKEGMWIRTSYNTGPYEIVDILRGCTCPEYVASLEYEDPPPSAPHIHLTLKKPGHRGNYWVGGIDERTLRSVWSKDRIFVVGPPKRKQLWLFKEDQWTSST